MIQPPKQDSGKIVYRPMYVLFVLAAHYIQGGPRKIAHFSKHHIFGTVKDKIVRFL